jgi:hypothetical protein
VGADDQDLVLSSTKSVPEFEIALSTALLAPRDRQRPYSENFRGSVKNGRFEFWIYGLGQGARSDRGNASMRSLRGTVSSNGTSTVITAKVGIRQGVKFLFGLYAFCLLIWAYVGIADDSSGHGPGVLVTELIVTFGFVVIKLHSYWMSYEDKEKLLDVVRGLV